MYRVHWLCVVHHGWATEKIFETETSKSGVYNESYARLTQVN